jgi:nucleoside-diphosphate-sugar epimerase
MVIGNGLMAKQFKAYQNVQGVVIFASGVSDSKSGDEAAFQKELLLAEQTLKGNPHSLFVYFSTCSINDPSLQQKPYLKHKLNIERKIAESGNRYMIFRVSNVAGRGGNPKTIFHFLATAVREGLPFDLWMHAYRNLIDADDVFALVDYLIAHGELTSITNIACPVSFHLPEMVRTMENYFGKKANYRKVEAGDFFNIDTTVVENIAPQAGVDFDGDYLRRLLSKYYPLHDVPPIAH